MKSLIFLALFLTGCVTTEVTEEQLAKHYESAVLSKDGKIWKLRGPIDYRITYDQRDDYDRWEALIRRHLNEMEEPRWSDFPKGWKNVQRVGLDSFVQQRNVQYQPERCFLRGQAEG